MGYFQVRYDSRVVIYERKMFIRLATGKIFTYYYKLSITLESLASLSLESTKDY